MMIKAKTFLLALKRSLGHQLLAALSAISLFAVTIGDSVGSPIAVTKANSEPFTIGTDVVSVMQVLNQSKDFDGKAVEVQGYLVYGFERHALYPTKEFADHSLDSTAISLALPAYRGERKPILAPQSRYLVVRGVFHSTGRNTGVFQGSLDQIDITEMKRFSDKLKELKEKEGAIHKDESLPH